MKTKRCIMVGAILLMLIGTVSATTTVDTIDYLGVEYAVVSGDVDLVFNWSERDNNSDIIISKITYINDTNMTVFLLISEAIVIDYSFDNNTKGYYYYCGNETYVIYVNYNSLKVPLDPLENIKNLLEQKNETIADLIFQLESMTINNTLNASEISTLISEINIMNDTIFGLQCDYNNYTKLEDDSTNKTIAIALLTGENRELRENNSALSSFVSLNPNLLYFIIGVILAILFIWKFRDWRFMKPFMKFFAPSEEILLPSTRDDEFEDLDKEVLENYKEIPVDNIVKKDQPKKEVVKKNVGYDWNSPEGMKRREQMRKDALGENK